MALKISSFFLFIFLVSSCNNQSTKEFEFPKPTGSNNANIFLPGIISKGLGERDFAISPDRKMLMYTIQSPKGNFSTLMICKQNKNGKYSKPEVASFSGQFSDLEPFFHPLKKELFFASNRPKDGIGNYFEEDFDIWKVSYSGTGFSKPQRLPETINTYLNEFYPSVAKSGNLYFTSTRDFGFGKEDIFVSRYSNVNYDNPEPLDSNINTEVYEFNAFINADENLIIFSSFGRLKGPGKGDMYFSRKNQYGNWSKARLLPSPINSKYLDFCPFLDEKENILYFSSERANFETPKNFNQVDSLTAFYNGPQSSLSDIYYVKWIE